MPTFSPSKDQGSGPRAAVGQPSTSTPDSDSRNLQLAAWHMSFPRLMQVFIRLRKFLYMITNDHLKSTIPKSGICGIGHDRTRSIHPLPRLYGPRPYIPLSQSAWEYTRPMMFPTTARMPLDLVAPWHWAAEICWAKCGAPGAGTIALPSRTQRNIDVENGWTWLFLLKWSACFPQSYVELCWLKGRTSPGLAPNQFCLLRCASTGTAFPFKEDHVREAHSNSFTLVIDTVNSKGIPIELV